MQNVSRYVLFFPIVIFFYIASVGILIPKGSILTQIFGISFFLITLYFNLAYVKLSYFKAIYFYLAYLIITIVLLSDNYSSSFKSLMKFSTSLVLFPVAFSVLNSPIKLKKLYWILFILSVIYLFNLLVANTLNLGGSKYSDEGIDVGNVFTDGLNSMAYTIVATPVMIYFFPKRKYIILTAMIFVFLMVLIQLKRISILATFVGLFIFLLLYKQKSKAIVGLALGGLIFSALFPFYADVFEAQLEKREQKLNVSNLEGEGRIMEFTWILSDLTESNSKLLFGHNLFNSPGNYKNPLSSERQIHNDYNALLHGSGLVGLVFFLFVQFNILYMYINIKNKLARSSKFLHIQTKTRSMLNYIFPAFFVMGLLLMFSGGIYAYLFNIIRYLVLGSTLGYLYKLYYSVTNNPHVFNSLLKRQANYVK
jgi:hypothetical protein